MKIPIRTSRKAISNVAATGILIATTVMMIISSYAIVLGYGQSSSDVIAADLTTLNIFRSIQYRKDLDIRS